MGIYLSTPNKEKHSDDGEYGTMRYGASGMQGWRTDMEDAHFAEFNIQPDTHIFGVFDGHGGKEVAKFVVKHFVKELLANEAFKKGDYPTSLHQTFLRMDELLSKPEGKKELSAIKSGERDSGDFVGESQAGCTANVGLIVGKTLYVANAGDSRCVLSSNGKAVEMSFDHKPDNEKEKDRVTKAGGYVSDGRINGNLNLSRALGDMEYKKDDTLTPGEQLISPVPDIEQRQLSADDEFLVFGCDGIWETKTNQGIVEFVADGLKSQNRISKVVEDLLDNILARDTSTGVGCDNMTCIVLSLK